MSSKAGATKRPRQQQKSKSKLIGWYLNIYNLAMAACWSFFLYGLIRTWWSLNWNPSSLIKLCRTDLVTVQSIAAIEIVHAALGLVPSGVLANLMQNFTRLFVILFAAKTLTEQPTKTQSWAFLAMATVWSLADIIRYLFYFSESIWPAQGKPGLLRKLRYSAFLLLYPIGAGSEVLLVEGARRLKVLERVFPWNYAVLGILAAYPFGFLYLYGHMLRQRAKQLKAHQS